VTLLLFLAFLFGSLLVVAAAMAFAPHAAAVVQDRLGEVTGTALAARRRARYEKLAMDSLKRLGEIAPKPAAELGKVQRRLVAAGYRGGEALVIFFGIRVGLALGLFVLCLTPLVIHPDMTLALVACLLGYIIPGIVLARMAKRRQHRIQVGLPDALDLLVVAVEAGLGLDQAILWVGTELLLAHPDLCDELRLINLELRAGKPRAEALQNLGARTGVDDVMSLVAMLVQTDKFGTSVAASLRVHSDTLRTKRRQRAEEKAAKMGAKMVFPLVFCIFPSIWVVTIGPAAITFMKVIGPMSGK
jgi:tight adherence protein C